MKKSVKILLIVLAVIAVAVISVVILFSMGIIGTGAELFIEADKIANESVNSMDALYGDLVEAEILKYCDTKIKGHEAKTLMSLLDQNRIEYLFISATGEIDESAKYIATASFSENGRIKEVIIDEQ